MNFVDQLRVTPFVLMLVLTACDQGAQEDADQLRGAISSSVFSEAQEQFSSALNAVESSLASESSSSSIAGSEQSTSSAGSVSAISSVAESSSSSSSSLVLIPASSDAVPVSSVSSQVSLSSASVSSLSSASENSQPSSASSISSASSQSSVQSSEQSSSSSTQSSSESSESSSSQSSESSSSSSSTSLSSESSEQSSESSSSVSSEPQPVSSSSEEVESSSVTSESSLSSESSSSSSESSSSSFSSLSSEASSSSSSSSSDGVGIFMGVGAVGRKTLSCDGGLTWIHDQSLDDDIRCAEGIDCDHHEGSAQGVIFVDGTMYATFGWGTPSTIQKSVNGVDWEVISSDDRVFHNMPAYGNGILVAGGNYPLRSFDLGETWDRLTSIGKDALYSRRFFFVPYEEGFFISLNKEGNPASHEIRKISTADMGTEQRPEQDAWKAATVFPQACMSGANDFGLVYGNGVMVIGGNGTPGICYSKDGGDTFHSIEFGDDMMGYPIWTGEKFWAFGPGFAMTSSDGENWDLTPTNLSDRISLRVVQYGNGNFVGVKQRWRAWYEDQVFYHSSDGINWSPLPEENYKGSHQIKFISYGEVSAQNSPCP